MGLFYVLVVVPAMIALAYVVGTAIIVWLAGGEKGSIRGQCNPDNISGDGMAARVIVGAIVFICLMAFVIENA